MEGLTETCCVCLEHCEIDINSFECQTCNDGKICEDCWDNINPRDDEPFFVCQRDEEDILKIIKCPCCRELNWKQLFSSVLGYLEVEIHDFWGKNKACDTLVKYWMERDKVSCTIYYKDGTQDWISVDDLENIDFTQLLHCKYRDVITLDFNSGKCSGCKCEISVEDCETNQNMMLWKGAMICEPCLNKNPKIYPKKELIL